MASEARILELAKRELGRDDLTLDTALEDAFADSLEWLDFVTVMQTELGDLAVEKITAAESFRQLAEAYDLPN